MAEPRNKASLVIDWVVLAAGCGMAGYLYVAHQPSGWAIGILAVVALVMAFSTPTPWQRATVVALAAVLFFLETRSITEDRAAQERQHVADMSGLNRQLGTILDTNRTGISGILRNAQTQFALTQGNLSGILSKDDKIRALSEQNLLSITGGDSFVYLEPSVTPFGNIALLAKNHGKYPLTDITASVYRQTEFPWTAKEIQIGTLAGEGFRALDYRLLPRFGADGLDNYMVVINAQNGVVQEYISIRKSTTPAKFAFGYKVGTVQLATQKPNGDMFVKIVLAQNRWSDEKGVKLIDLSKH